MLLSHLGARTHTHTPLPSVGVCVTVQLKVLPCCCSHCSIKIQLINSLSGLETYLSIPDHLCRYLHYTVQVTHITETSSHRHFVEVLDFPQWPQADILIYFSVQKDKKEFFF